MTRLQRLASLYVEPQPLKVSGMKLVWSVPTDERGDQARVDRSGHGVSDRQDLPRSVHSCATAPVTTNDTIVADLRASLIARGVDAGSTVGDFIAALRQAGIRECDALASIEFGVGQYGMRRIVFERDGNDAVEVREVR